MVPSHLLYLCVRGRNKDCDAFYKELKFGQGTQKKRLQKSGSNSLNLYTVWAYADEILSLNSDEDEEINFNEKSDFETFDLFEYLNTCASQCSVKVTWAWSENPDDDGMYDKYTMVSDRSIHCFDYLPSKLVEWGCQDDRETLNKYLWYSKVSIICTMSNEEIEEHIRNLLAGNPEDLDEIEDFIYDAEDYYFKNLGKFAFMEAVRCGAKCYVDEHADEFELNNDENGSPYLEVTDDPEMLQILRDHGAQ